VLEESDVAPGLLDLGGSDATSSREPGDQVKARVLVRIRGSERLADDLRIELADLAEELGGNDVCGG